MYKLKVCKLKITKSLSAALCLFLLSHNAFSNNFADTLKLREVLITADKIVKEQAGKTITRIDSVSMIKAVNSNLSELISQNTPIFIKEYGRGAMATASFRGTAPSHTQVSWNGINLSSPMLGMVDFSTIPVYFIDDVSLLHGSASLSEKSGALGGTVKLQNNVDWQNHFSGRALTGIGSYGTLDEFLRVNLGNKKIQVQSRGYYNQSDNDYLFNNKFNADIDPVTGNYIYPKQRNQNAAYQNWGILEELYYRPAEKSILTFRYWYQHNDRSLPKLLTNESGNDANINRQIEDAHRALAEWKKYGEKGTLTISSGLNIQLLSYWLRTKVFGTEDQYVIDSDSKSASWENKIRYNYQLKKDLSLITGIDADLHHVDSRNTPQTGDPSGYNKSRSENSIFIQLSKDFGDKAAAYILGRQNLIDGRLTAFMPSLGVEYHPFISRQFFLKANIARNYHEPSLNDLYYIPGGNPELKSEKGATTEAGTGYSGKIGNSTYHVNVNGYISEIENWIIWLPSPQGYWEPFNMKKVDASGLEFNTGLNGNILNFNYQFNGNYAYTRSINKDDPQNWADESVGKQLPYIPLHSANFLFDISRNGFHVTWMWNYYSKRYTTTSTDKESRLDVIYPYIMNNLCLGKEIGHHKRKLDIELKIYNLFNEDYRTVLQLPMPGRNYSLLLRYDF
jgi:outer membrane cobalamin receptor